MAYLILYCLIGGSITFGLFHWWTRDLYLNEDNIFALVLTGVFWPIATPFAVGVIYAIKQGKRR